MADSDTLIAEYLSVLLGAWTDALAPHLAALLELPFKGQVPSPRERSHSVAVVAMSAFAIESHARRLICVGRAQDRADVIKALRSTGRFAEELLTAIAELFLVRDTLVHNHVWRMRGTSDRSGFTAVGIEKLSGFESKDHLLAEESRVTRGQNLNVVPHLVGYGDARVAVRILIDALDACAAADVENMPSPADQAIVELSGGRRLKLRRFGEMPSEPPGNDWR